MQQKIAGVNCRWYSWCSVEIWFFQLGVNCLEQIMSSYNNDCPVLVANMYKAQGKLVYIARILVQQDEKSGFRVSSTRQWYCKFSCQYKICGSSHRASSGLWRSSNILLCAISQFRQHINSKVQVGYNQQLGMLELYEVVLFPVKYSISCRNNTVAD